jgi:hypothetical protein
MSDITVDDSFCYVLLLCRVKGLALVFFVYLKVKIWRNLYHFGGFVCMCVRSVCMCGLGVGCVWFWSRSERYEVGVVIVLKYQ